MGPSSEHIHAIVELKLRNPRLGYPRIVQQINKAFGTNINKDVVRRVLTDHYIQNPVEAGHPDRPFSATRRRASGSLTCDVRELVYQGYRIIYLTRPEWVFIVTIIHGSRDLADIDIAFRIIIM